MVSFLRKNFIVAAFFFLIFPFSVQASASTFISNLYCRTIGLWTNDISCNPISELILDSVASEPATPPVPIPKTVSIPQTISIDVPQIQKTTTPLTIAPTVVERAIEKPVDLSRFITDSFFSKQLEGIYNSLDKLAHSLSERIDAIDVSGDGTGISDLSSFDTDDLAEGSHLYYTDPRVGSYISGSSTIPHIGGSAYGDVLVWNGSSWTNSATSSLGISSGSSYANSDASAFIHASTTIPKTYTSNTFTGSNAFNAGLSGGSAGQFSVNSLGNVVLTSGTQVYMSGGSASSPTLTTPGLNAGMYFPSSDALAFSTAGIERLRIDLLGNIGIGTTTPYEKLSVAGTVVGQNFIATSTTATSTFNGPFRVNYFGNTSQTTGTSTMFTDHPYAGGTSDGRAYGLRFFTNAPEHPGIWWTNDTTDFASIFAFTDHGGSQNNMELLMSSIGDIALTPNSGNGYNGGRIQLGLASVMNERVTLQYKAAGGSVSHPNGYSNYLDTVVSYYDGSLNTMSGPGQRGEYVGTNKTELAFYNPGINYNSSNPEWLGTQTNKKFAVTTDGIWANGFVVGTTTTAGWQSTTTPPVGGAIFQGNVGVGTSSPYKKFSVTGEMLSTGTSTASCFSTDGATCITGSGGSGTVGSGTAGQTPYYAANGTTLTASSSVFINTSTGKVAIGTTTTTSASLNIGTNIEIPKTTSATIGNIVQNGTVILKSPGTSNFGIGPNTLNYSLTSAQYNLAIGDSSLASCTTCISNMGIGPFTLNAVTTAAYNVAIGQNALYANTSGYNVGIGFAAGQNSSGSVGVYIGNEAGLSATGAANVLIGPSAGRSSTGGSNTIIGYNAGYNLGSGAGNIIIGQSLDVAQPNVSGQINIGGVLFGTGAYSSISPNISTPTASGKIGIGSTTPWRTLGVTGTVGFDGLTGSTGAGSICLSANKELVYNSGSDACLPSLKSTKHDITDLSFDALSIITRLKPVSFVYNVGDQKTRYGFIAEDTRDIDAHLATYNAEGEVSGIDDRAVTSLLTKAIKELDFKLDMFISSTSSAPLVSNDGVLSFIIAKFSEITVTIETLVSDTITAAIGNFKKVTVTEGVEMKDSETGTIYCLTIKNGQTHTEEGECGSSDDPEPDPQSDNSSGGDDQATTTPPITADFENDDDTASTTDEVIEEAPADEPIVQEESFDPEPEPEPSPEETPSETEN